MTLYMISAPLARIKSCNVAAKRTHASCRPSPAPTACDELTVRLSHRDDGGGLLGGGATDEEGITGMVWVGQRGWETADRYLCRLDAFRDTL